MAGKIAEDWSMEYTSKILKTAIFQVKKIHFFLKSRFFVIFDRKIDFLDPKIGKIAI